MLLMLKYALLSATVLMLVALGGCFSVCAASTRLPRH